MLETADAVLVFVALPGVEADKVKLVIHEGGDNYSDTPKPLGGGGGRIACGVVPEPSGAAKTKPAK